MFRKRVLAFGIALLMLLSLAACQTNENASGEGSRPDAAAAEKPTQDRSGNAITIPDTVEKVIVLAPSTAQVLAEIGLTGKIIACDTQTPLYVTGLKEGIPQFDMMQPDLEQLLSLKPDIVFVSGLSSLGGDDAFKTLRDAGICVADIPSSNSISDVKKDVEFIADCMGKSAEGKKLTADMQTDIDAISAIGKTITDKKSILFEIASAPSIYSFGKGVFLHEMIELIGATNALGDQNSWISVTEEAAVAANPDVILTNVSYEPDPVGNIKKRAGWENVSAVKNNAVYYIDNGASSLPNHHIVDALKQMAKAVYPEQYKDIVSPLDNAGK